MTIVSALTLAIVVIAAMVGALALSAPYQNAIFASESSVAEQGAIWLWIIAALAVPVILGRATRRTLAASIVCLGCAAREADLHNLFTNYSILKIGFYVRSEFGVLERAIAFASVTAVAISIVVAAAAVFRHARKQGWHVSWVRLLLAILLFVAVGKAVDRLPALLSEVGVFVGPSTRSLMTLIEEVVELLLPVLFLFAVIRFARTERRA